MPENKRQHYLAQQQMRRWSATGKAIRALDKKIPKIIERVSIRTTAQENHYYEKTSVGVEDALAQLEREMKAVVDRIYENQELPTLEDSDRFILMVYASTQLVRKEQLAGPARRAMTELAQQTLGMLERNGQLPPRPKEIEGVDLKVEVEEQWPRQMAVATGFEAWPLLADLEVMLIKSSRNRILLPDEGLLWVNRIAPAAGIPHGLGSMGACLLLPIGPEYCVVWFDWGVYRRSGSGKIHEMSEHEELDFGATAILLSERLTYYNEGATDWCVRCAQHAWKVQQADGGWRPIPGLDTPHGDKWDAMPPPD